MGDPYATAPLDLNRNGVRLIQVQPSEETEIVKCILRAYNDDVHPSYTALSYVWGPDQIYDGIELNGTKMPVRRNLWFFLRKMQIQHYYEPLWIDAICINQSKIHELNHQVRKMGQIYGCAQQVFVWLGEADETSDIAMRKLRTRKPLDGGQNKLDKLWNSQQAQSILVLCERNYWRRMWIIQEVVLARAVTIHCGSLELSWERLIQLLNDLQVVSDRGRELHIQYAHAILVSPAMALVKFKKGWDGTPRPLKGLLQTYCDHESTDIRDKIYALFGIADNMRGVVIDYHKSAKDILLLVFLYERNRLRWGIKARAELVSFAKLLRRTLKVGFDDEEMDFHLARIPLQGIEYRCLFEFLHCSFLSHEENTWMKHCESHFEGTEPPRTVSCSLCGLYEKRFGNGQAAWNFKLEHIISHKLEVQAGIRESYPIPPSDFGLFEHLWQNQLIDDLDLQELVIGSHSLFMPPLTRSKWSKADDTLWSSVERCTICYEELERPILPDLNEFRSDSWGTTENYCRTTETDVMKFLRNHQEESEATYRSWLSRHAHGTTQKGRPDHLVYLQPLNHNAAMAGSSTATRLAVHTYPWGPTQRHPRQEPIIAPGYYLASDGNQYRNQSGGNSYTGPSDTGPSEGFRPEDFS
ncbi:HET-domain-containing protein [Lophiostoma macrostomum CBS 122681]|uniref:HET-domain-containing protein n=1 Tax=Lophiostoma macrostomum CBS 122681 TaxID=1314788 RepID=A0A6A6SU56_9PLEO|nr:HET-domain-containing protein [Lophiostoma macrostomum CBS 122681]